VSTIIVVDDDQVFSGLLRTVLEMEGYQVELVPYPDDVVPAVRRVKPALVLMDVHTGHGDTLGILRELQADEELKIVPVVMTSGMECSAECLTAGAECFILKPFRPAELIDLVAELVDK
jgi:DNA-binding response OmpR family regulator